MADLRRLHPRLTETDLDSEPFVPELSPVVNPYGDSLMTRPWLDWARRLTLLVGVKSTGGGGGGTGDVVGPAGATPDAIALYSGSTGKLIKDSLTSIGSVISQAVSQAIAAILPGGKLPVSNLPLHHTLHEPGGADAMAVDAAAAVGSLRTLGTGPNQAAPGNDPRFVPGMNLDYLGDYAPATYNDGDIVVASDGVAYMCVKDGTTTPPEAWPGGAPPLAAHHFTHEPGGSDAIVGAAWTAVANVFTQPQKISDPTQPTLFFNETAQAANARQWKLTEQNGYLLAQPANDAGVAPLTALQLARNGDVSASNLFATGSGGNVACKDQQNIFTQPQTLSLANPYWAVVDTSQPANLRRWMMVSGGQNLHFQPCNDAGAALLDAIVFQRSGSAFLAGDVTEKGRATPMGHWTNVPFSAANFGDVVTGQSFTVVAGGISTNHYTMVGKTMFWSIYGQGTYSGTNYHITVAIPGGFLNTIQTDGTISVYAVDAAGLARATAFTYSSGYIVIRKEGAVWSNGVIVFSASIAFQVN